LELRIPKLRAGSFFPSLLERRRRGDQALFAVVMEAYLHGVSTRKVDDLVRALGADSGISKSEVSWICADLDSEVSAFRDRSLAGQVFRYVFVDATYCKARVNRRVVSQAVVVATWVCGDGRREVLGFAVGALGPAPRSIGPWAGHGSPMATRWDPGPTQGETRGDHPPMAGVDPALHSSRLP
jgi:putative transposase